MNASLFRLIPAVVVIALLATIVAQPRTSSAQSPGMDHPIVQAGLTKLGGHGGQCYVFAANAVREATGMVIGRGYRQGYLDAGGVEVSPDNARAGDVLQISNPNNHSQYYPGMHTVIVIENLGNRTYRVIDSNRSWDERVQIHTWTPRPAAPLQLYAYRFDNGSTGSASAPAPAPTPPPASNPGPAPELAVGATATVDAGSSCLRLRGAAGTDKTILNCLSAGSTVTVLSEATQANGYTWVKVRTASGQEGWVASEFLTAVSAPETPATPEAPAEPEATPEPTEPPAPPTATPEPEAPAADPYAVGATVTVDTEGSCLYLRGNSGLGGAIMDCMRDGTNVTVIGGAIEADGYTWLQVETANGVKGWSAKEFLTPAD